MSRTPRVVTLCVHPLNCRHVCMFTESDEERYRILNPFLAEGLAAGEEVLTIVDAQALAEHAQRMQEGGVPVDDAVASGQLQLLASDDTYGRDGTFAAERMYAFVQPLFEAGQREGLVRAELTVRDGVEQFMRTIGSLLTVAPPWPRTQVQQREFLLHTLVPIFVPDDARDRAASVLLVAPSRQDGVPG